MWRRIKYLISHAMGATRDKILSFKGRLSVDYFGHISNIILTVALGLGLYSRWMLSQDAVILTIIILALFVFSISCAMIYYFSMDKLGMSLTRLWLGCLLGVVAFTEQIKLQYETSEEIMDALFLSSIVVKCFGSILIKIMKLPHPETSMDQYEMLEIIGIGAASFLCGDDIWFPFCLLLIAFATTLFAMRLKSFLAVLNIIAMIIICSVIIFPRYLYLAANPYALICFIIRLAFDPFLDLFLSNKTRLERWQPLLSRSGIWQKLFILSFLILEITFYAIMAKQMPRHKEWFIVVPIFIGFSIIWCCYHLAFFITCWQLASKISDCFMTYRSLTEENRNLQRIMASKGIRHFSLIAKRLTCVTLITTVLLMLIGWTTHTAISFSLFFIVAPLESTLLSLLWELGSVLGGTCTGYAVVAPSISFRPSNGMTTVLPTSAVQDLGSRATTTLSYLQRFFTYHLIDTFGCDYSTSGLAADSIETKLRSYFQRTTADGPRFDTYILFYSGHVYENGDWALAGSSSLKLDTILEWWREYNVAKSSSRLILVLDTDHSYSWLREVRNIPDQMVAMQTFRYIRSNDPEEGKGYNIGDFTAEWISYNLGQPGINWHEKDRAIRAVYSVSRCWADFTFHLPTEEDIKQYCQSNFPRMSPLIKITNLPRAGDLVCCSDCFLHCLRRWRFAWFPPLEIDTDHGFRIIKS